MSKQIKLDPKIALKMLLLPLAVTYKMKNRGNANFSNISSAIKNSPYRKYFCDLRKVDHSAPVKQRIYNPYSTIISEQVDYLHNSGYIKKYKNGFYVITKKGEKLIEKPEFDEIKNVMGTSAEKYIERSKFNEKRKNLIAKIGKLTVDGQIVYSDEKKDLSPGLNLINFIDHQPNIHYRSTFYNESQEKLISYAKNHTNYEITGYCQNINCSGDSKIEIELLIEHNIPINIETSISCWKQTEIDDINEALLNHNLKLNIHRKDDKWVAKEISDLGIGVPDLLKIGDPQVFFKDKNLFQLYSDLTNKYDKLLQNNKDIHFDLNFSKLKLQKKLEEIENKELCALAARSFTQINERRHPILNENTGKRDRTAFQTDCDRIIYSKAYRRLKHKTQVYWVSHTKLKDHIRTRLTHTLQVVQLSKSMARSLHLNTDLAEAIALGHDLGHTPFGHVGERVLNEIMRGEDNLGGIIWWNDSDFYRLKENSYGFGFKHNYQSVRIVELLETKYKEYPGLNLTPLVKEGIIKHTKIGNYNYLFQNENELYLDYKHSVSLEGQIVEICDEIAQFTHDLEDAFELGYLKLDDFDRFPNINEYNCLKEILNKYKGEEINILTTFKRKRILEKYHNEFIHNLVFTLLSKVLDVSFKKINEYIEKNPIHNNENQFTPITEHLINIENEELKLFKDIKNQIEYKPVLNSFDVNRLDGKSRFILRRIIKAYLTNIRQIPDVVLQNYQEELKENEFKSLILTLKMLKEKVTHFNSITEESINIIKKEQSIFYNKYFKRSKIVKLMLGQNNCANIDDKSEIMGKVEELVCEYKTTPKIDLYQYTDELIEFNIFSKEDMIQILWLIDEIYSKDSFRWINQKVFSQFADVFKHDPVFLRLFCDYIASMSDNSAEDEYKLLYG